MPYKVLERQRNQSITEQMLLLIIFIISSTSSEQLIDLTHPFDENAMYWNTTGIPFRFIKKKADTSRGYWLASYQFEMAEHSGTHLDAPYHFNQFGWKLAEIPLSRLITTGVFLNASSETNGNCSFKLTPRELNKWEFQNGPFPYNSILLISFGWASKYNNKTEYVGPAGKICFPGLSKEAAEWITRSRKIVAVGVDTASVDQAFNYEAHIELTSKNIYMMENLALIHPLPMWIPKIYALPMKTREGTGGPCRVVADLCRY